MVQVPGYLYTYTPTMYQPQAPNGPIGPTAYSHAGYVYPVSYQQPVAAAAAPSAQGWVTPGTSVATPSQYYYYVYPTVMACPGGTCYRR